MQSSPMPMPFLESVLNTSNHKHIEKAIEELNILREINHHLFTHFAAVKMQTASSGDAILGLFAKQSAGPGAPEVAPLLQAAS